MAGFGPDMTALLIFSRENLTACLSKIPGKKQLILETGLMRPLDRIAGMSVLSKSGVESVMKLERGPAPALSPGLTRCYLIPSNLIQAKYVADQISEIVDDAFQGKIHVILVPRKLSSIENLFEEEGLAGYVELHQYAWEFIPLDYDLLSLEQSSFFRNQYLLQDHSGLVGIARALWGLQSVYGEIPNVVAQGRSVRKILNMAAVFSQQYGRPPAKQGDIGQLFIFERDVDWTACLLSPLTYEGLLDEVFGISCGTVEFGKEVTGQDAPTKLQLSSKDKMFDKIRNKHFASIFSVLGVTAKQLSAAQAAASSMNVSQMKQFVQNDLKVMKAQSRAVALHIGASERIQRLKGRHFETQLPVEHSIVSNINTRENISYIEERMAQLVPLSIPLRLICLLSHCSDGLAASDLARLKTQLVQAYGFHHLLTWSNLLKLGLIKSKNGEMLTSSSSSSKLGMVSQQVAGLVPSSIRVGGSSGGAAGTFQAAVKRLGLVPDVDQLSLSEPNSPGYVFNGAYIPLTCRVVQEVVKAAGSGSLVGGPAASGRGLGAAAAVAEALKLLPGETVLDFRSDKAPKVALVVYVGGYTMAELAAFRWLGTLTGWQFIIAGTCNISAGKIIADCERL